MVMTSSSLPEPFPALPLRLQSKSAEQTVFLYKPPHLDCQALNPVARELLNPSHKCRTFHTRCGGKRLCRFFVRFSFVKVNGQRSKVTSYFYFPLFPTYIVCYNTSYHNDTICPVDKLCTTKNASHMAVRGVFPFFRLFFLNQLFNFALGGIQKLLCLLTRFVRLSHQLGYFLLGWFW